MELPLIHLDKSQLCRAGFRHILQNSQFRVGWDGPGWEEAGPAILGLKPVMIVTDLSCQTGELADFLASLTCLPFVPKIVLFSASQPSMDIIPSIARIDGYISKDLSADSLLHALGLIHGGQKIFPPEIIAHLADSASGDHCGSTGLTARELQILQFLSSGHSNKKIAIDLAIAEGTVKSHLKAVMKKTRATNRTQAAMWAVANGIGAQ